MNAAEAAAALRAHAADIACHLLGKPTFRTRHELRWRNKGSLSLQLREGRWTDFEADGRSRDMLDLIQYVRGGSVADAIRWAEDWLGNPVAASPAPQRRKEPPPPDLDIEADRQRRKGIALSLWEKAKPIEGTLAERYLKARGIPDDAIATALHVMRFDPACRRGEPYFDAHPALVCLITHIVTNEPLAVHRTYLLPDGSWRLPGDGAKLALGPSKGGCIRLSPDDAVTGGLSIVEGVETGLSIIGIGVRPVWSVLNAGGIATFPVLSGVECLNVYADNDRAKKGQEAAQRCFERWAEAGQEVIVRTPNVPDADWNDVLCGRAA